MKKENKKTKEAIIGVLNTGIFPATILFCYGLQYKEIKSRLKKQKCHDWLIGISDSSELIEKGNYLALRRDIENTKTGEEKILFYIIIKEEFKFTDYEYCKLAHECYHICQFMMKDFLDPDREFECVAYTHTHIMRQCLNLIREAK